jgi:hypothetical protein
VSTSTVRSPNRCAIEKTVSPSWTVYVVAVVAVVSTRGSAASRLSERGSGDAEALAGAVLIAPASTLRTAAGTPSWTYLARVLRVFAVKVSPLLLTLKR